MRFGKHLFNDKVFISKSAFPPIKITFLVNEKVWRLEQEFKYKNIVIPQNFKFDLASIPRIFWWIIAPFELSVAAPLVHDYLYRRKGVTSFQVYKRSEVDNMFRDIMKFEGISWWRRFVAYRGVRLFGWIPW